MICAEFSIYSLVGSLPYNEGSAPLIGRVVADPSSGRPDPVVGSPFPIPWTSVCARRATKAPTKTVQSVNRGTLSLGEDRLRRAANTHSPFFPRPEPYRLDLYIPQSVFN